jgi:hypothetical protein
MTSEEARKINAEFDGQRPPSLDVFLEYVGLTEAEFNEMVTSTAVSPYEHDFASNKTAQPTWDAVKWYREDNRKKP